MRPYDPLPRFYDPQPKPIPRQSGWGIMLAWAFAGLILIGTAMFLFMAAHG
jgi:hypothetical protein